MNKTLGHCILLLLPFLLRSVCGIVVTPLVSSNFNPVAHQWYHTSHVTRHTSNGRELALLDGRMVEALTTATTGTLRRVPKLPERCRSNKRWCCGRCALALISSWSSSESSSTSLQPMSPSETRGRDTRRTTVVVRSRDNALALLLARAAPMSASHC